MLNLIRLLLISYTLLLSPIPSIAQLNFSSITARAGVIRTLWTDNSIYSGHLWSFYPEIEVGGKFIAPYLHWGASWGYWSDRIDHTLPVMDMVTYSQSSHIVALRLEFRPKNLDGPWPLPVKVFAGAAEHFIKNKYIGGLDLTGTSGDNSWDQATAAFIGLGVSIPVLSHLNLELEALQFIPFGGDLIAQAQKKQRTFKCGAEVIF